MNSNLPIPGLGQLESIDTSQPSDPVIESDSTPVAANGVPDINMTEERSVGLATGENLGTTAQTSLADTEAQVYDAIKVQDSNVVVDEGSAEDVNMQDQQSHEDDATAPATTTSVAVPGPQDSDMAGFEEVRVQQVAGGSPAASPRITDALEAVLDGFLGPANQVATENTVTPDGNQAGGEQLSENPVHENPIPASDHPPVEGTADENPEWEVDSSPYESSSSDSSDSSEDDESDVEESKLGIEETARLLMEADGGSDDEMDGVRAAKQAAGVRTKNEQPDEPEPMPDIKIEAGEAIMPLGIVRHIVEGVQIVIEALQDGTANTVLDRGTPLCKEDRTVLGTVHDTIATVHKPMYVLKFKSEEEVKAAGLERGTQIWYPKSLANLVFPSQLRQEKGSDASNLHDEEVGPDEVEYSDDEQEQAHKREKKNRKRGKGKSNNRGDDHDWRVNNNNGEGNLRYDEDDDGPYKPLSRPANFGMGLPPPPPPGVSAFPAAHSGRGGQHQGRRGDSRGRVGRGRGFSGRGRGSHGHNGHQSVPQPQNNYQPPPPFATNPPPVPGQWPFPMPPVPPQFGGSAPSNPNAPSTGYAMPNWGATGQSVPFPFPPVPPVPNWPTPTAQRPPQQASYSPPTGGYSMPVPYPPNGAANASAPPPNNYQYPNYYGGGQAQNSQSQQRWG